MQLHQQELHKYWHVDFCISNYQEKEQMHKDEFNKKWNLVGDVNNKIYRSETMGSTLIKVKKNANTAQKALLEVLLQLLELILIYMYHINNQVS